MKIILILGLFLISCATICAADSAFELGSKSLSGTLSFTHLGGDAYTGTDLLEFNPKYTVAISDGLFVGAVLQVRYINVGFYDDTQWQIGGIVERYFTKDADVDGKVIPLFKTFVMIGKDDSITLINFGLNFGFLKMISSSVGIDFGIKGVYDRFSFRSSSVSGFTLQAAVGVSSFII